MLEAVEFLLISGDLNMFGRGDLLSRKAQPLYDFRMPFVLDWFE
jgi:hypothetical protein